MERTSGREALLTNRTDLDGIGTHWTLYTHYEIKVMAHPP